MVVVVGFGLLLNPNPLPMTVGEMHATIFSVSSACVYKENTDFVNSVINFLYATPIQ